MSNPCTSLETLAAYGERQLPEKEREALERHAGACPRCRGLLLNMNGLETLVEEAPALREATLAKALSVPQPPRRRSPRGLVAAAVLLAVSLGWMAFRNKETAQILPRAPSALPATALPEGRLGAGGTPAAFLATGVDLVLEAGTRVHSQDRILALDAGRLWLEVREGSPLTLKLPQAGFLVKEGALVARVQEKTSEAGWLPEAFAGEIPETEVWVLQGNLEVLEGGRIRQVAQGLKLRFSEGRWQEQPLPDGDLRAAWEARALAVAAAPGLALAAKPFRLSPSGRAGAGLAALGGEAPAAFRWVTVVSGRSAATELGFTLPAGGAWHQWVAGLGARTPGTREVVEITWDGARFLGRLDGRVCFSAGRAQLPELLKPAPRQGWGISAWGGTATVERSTLMTMLQGEFPGS